VSQIFKDYDPKIHTTRFDEIIRIEYVAVKKDNYIVRIYNTLSFMPILCYSVVNNSGGNTIGGNSRVITNTTGINSSGDNTIGGNNRVITNTIRNNNNSGSRVITNTTSNNTIGRNNIGGNNIKSNTVIPSVTGNIADINLIVFFLLVDKYTINIATYITQAKKDMIINKIHHMVTYFLNILESSIDLPMDLAKYRGYYEPAHIYKRKQILSKNMFMNLYNPQQYYETNGHYREVIND